LKGKLIVEICREGTAYSNYSGVSLALKFARVTDEG